MEPGVDLTICARPLPPLPARAVDGNLMVEPVPSVQALPAASTRYWEKFAVVPEESERTARVIAELGRLTPGLSAVIAGSFQVLIWPWKIFARVVASSFSPVMPDRLYAMAIGPTCTGKYSTVLPAGTLDVSEAGIGESEPAKSTVLEYRSLRPVPEPPGS